MEYQTVTEFANKLGVTRRAVLVWLQRELIPGATFAGQSNWLIPVDAKRPELFRGKPRKSP